MGRSAVSSAASLRPELAVPLSARGPPSRGPPLSARTPRAPLTRLEFEAQRRMREHGARFLAMQEQRAEDEKLIKERCERIRQARDQRCEALIENIRLQEPLREGAREMVEAREERLTVRRQELYEVWDANVGQRVEYHLQRYMAAQPPPCPPTFRNRPNLVEGDDPLKTILREQRLEEQFHRTANSVVRSMQVQVQEATPRNGVPASRKQPLLDEASVRSCSRPVFPIELWEQRQHYASLYGRFSQGFENGPNGVCTSRRQGTNAFRVDESDGVPAAGKAIIKTRAGVLRNQVFMLEGTLAKEGQSARYKRDYGASSAAPCQDHYGYEVGSEVVESEFPLGRRTYFRTQPSQGAAIIQ